MIVPQVRSCHGATILLGAGVLRNGLGALGHGVLGQFSWEQESDCSLDLPGGDGGALVVVGEPGSLGGDPLEDVIDEGVHDGHGLGRDASVGMHLLQDLVDVDGVRLLPAPLGGALPVLARRGDGLLGLARLLGGARCGGGGSFSGLGRHDALKMATGEFRLLSRQKTE